MSKTEYVFVQGKCKFAPQLTVPNPWGKWTCCIYPNIDSLEKVEALRREGIKNVLKKDEDGTYVTFNRPVNKEIKGRLQGFAPVEVLEADGKTPFKHMIGIGSDLTLKLEVYQHNVPGGTAKSARLLSVRVDNLVPFEMKRDFTDEQLKAVKGLDEQPEQFF